MLSICPLIKKGKKEKGRGGGGVWGGEVYLKTFLTQLQLLLTSVSILSGRLLDYLHTGEEHFYYTKTMEDNMIEIMSYRLMDVLHNGGMPIKNPIR